MCHFSFYRTAKPDHDHDSYLLFLSIPHPAVPGKPLAKVLKPDSETSSIPSRFPLSRFTDRANGEHDCVRRTSRKSRKPSISVLDGVLTFRLVIRFESQFPQITGAQTQASARSRQRRPSTSEEN